MYYLNGNFYKEEPIFNDFFYGQSVFETMLGINGKIIFLEEHIKRMKKSAKLLDINVKREIKNELKEVLNKFKNDKEFMVKIQVSNNNIYIKIIDFVGREAESGIKAQFVKNYYQIHRQS